MSLLAGRLAGKEGAYFFQESKQAVGRLVSQKKLPSSPLSATEYESQADVLPEVLRHSLPSKIFHQQAETASLWTQLPNGFLNLSPRMGISSLLRLLTLSGIMCPCPRWQLPESENSISASTANELRRDRHPTPINPENLKAAAEGLTRIGAAFAIATAIVFGGATLVFGLAVSRLQVQNSDDIRTKGKELVEPNLKGFVENMTRKWHLEKQEDVKEKPLVKALSKMFAAKTSN
ncbi:hypothetical protein ACLB2K_062229 [Fragaria x ananassa]